MKVPAVVLACVLVAGALVGWAVYRANEEDNAGQPNGTTSSQPGGVASSTAPRSTPVPSTQRPPSITSSKPASPTTKPTASTSKPASPTKRPTSSTAPGSVPAGFERHTDASGFSVAIPTGWTMQREGAHIYFREPGGSRFLLVDQTDQPKADPVADWREQEAARKDGYADYQRIRIEPVDYFEKAADWEFTYSTSSGPRHVLIRGVVTSAHQAYGLYWSTPDSRWNESLPLYRTITATFRPAP
jgi:hypothetical protein